MNARNHLKPPVALGWGRALAAAVVLGWSFGAVDSRFMVHSAGAHPWTSRLQGTAATSVVVNEVLYDPPVAGAETDAEWIELYNAGGEPVSLGGWKIADNRAEREIPELELPAGGFVIVAGGTGFRAQYPAYQGLLIELGAAIGNGLGNTGDEVRLIDPSGAPVDGMSYGGDVAVLDPAVALVDTGHSVERVPAGLDTDTARDWVNQERPSPGESAFTTPTATSTLAAPSSPTPAGTQPAETPRLNELLPAPREVDWNGDGVLDSGDEWVEIFNRGDVEWDLSGWQLDDIADGGSPPWTAPNGTTLPPRGYLLLFGTITGLAFNNEGDEARLLSPEGDVVDSVGYANARVDTSLSRNPDGAGPWSDALAPTPGLANAAPDARTPSTTATAAVTPPPTPQPGLTPGAHFPLLISEIMYDGQGPGPDASGEWVELHNPGSVPVGLVGWRVGDGTGQDPLPDIAVPSGGFVVIAAESMAGGAAIADGRIGNGLANQGDVVRLLQPTGDEVDAVSYGSNLSAFDPSVPLAPPGASIERIPAGHDTNDANDWWSQDPPTPGRAGVPPEPVPRVVINEVMPSPRSRDWDGDGVAGYEDEWIELYNAGAHAVRLAEWTLVVGDNRWSATLPDMVVESRALAVLWRRDTGLFLDNADALALIRADGVVADRVLWDRSPGADRVWGRPEDGALGWTDGLVPTPGMPNLAVGPAPESDTSSQGAPVRVVAPLAALTGVRTGDRVSVRGVVTAPPGVMGRRVFYLGDATSGIRVQVTGDGPDPALATGDVVRVTGRYGWSLGEPYLRTTVRDLAREAAGPEPVPIPARTGDLAALVGRLASVAGRVDGWESTAVYLDDGSGAARILFRTAAGVAKPWVERTQWMRAAGIVGRFARDPDKPGGYRLMPRGPADVTDPTVLPSRWPAAGRAVPAGSGNSDSGR